MRIHYLQHVPFEGPGHIANWARKSRYRLSATRLFDQDPLPDIDSFDWLIVLGGPMGACDERLYPWLTEEKRFIGKAIEGGKITLGICLGAQLVASVLGARVFRNRYKEIGWFPVQKTEQAAGTTALVGFRSEFEAFHWHSDTFEIPSGCVRLARSCACENQAFLYGKHVVALQFHLETTREGARLLLRNCPNDLERGRYVQSVRAIRSNETGFRAIGRSVRLLLGQLERTAVAVPKAGSNLLSCQEHPAACRISD